MGAAEARAPLRGGGITVSGGSTAAGDHAVDCVDASREGHGARGDRPFAGRPSVAWL